MYNILVCDDDRDIVNALKIYLSAEGYNTFEAYTGREALEVAGREDIHLILMDVMMPEMDGIAATLRLRERHNIPIILLTAKSEDTDKVLGLNTGADDYVTKPFNPLELQARVRSQLRRYTKLGGMTASEGSEGRLAVGGVELDDKAKRVSVDGEEVALTPTEFAILRLLLGTPGKVFSTGEIYERVSGGDSAFASRSAVAVHIRHLREKIEINPSEPRYLKVVWGQGYKIERLGAATGGGK
ncbi:MAG: response regulator transcription factor [Clostridiales Family XIII bacterium]|jgi:DNA-binding response OmpR family regulator|nr:response regulator transcription factor [Clostridiales Family XIII bacterium]